MNFICVLIKGRCEIAVSMLLLATVYGLPHILISYIHTQVSTQILQTLGVQSAIRFTSWIAPRFLGICLHIAIVTPFILINDSNLISVLLLHNIIDLVMREYMCCEAESHQQSAYIQTLRFASAHLATPLLPGWSSAFPNMRCSVCSILWDCHVMNTAQV